MGMTEEEENDDIVQAAHRIWDEISHDSLFAIGVTCCLAKACLKSCHPNDIDFIRGLLATADQEEKIIATQH